MQFVAQRTHTQKRNKQRNRYFSNLACIQSGTCFAFKLFVWEVLCVAWRGTSARIACALVHNKQWFVLLFCCQTAFWQSGTELNCERWHLYSFNTCSIVVFNFCASWRLWEPSGASVGFSASFSAAYRYRYRNHRAVSHHWCNQHTERRTWIWVSQQPLHHWLTEWLWYSSMLTAIMNTTKQKSKSKQKKIWQQATELNGVNANAIGQKHQWHQWICKWINQSECAAHTLKISIPYLFWILTDMICITWTPCTSFSSSESVMPSGFGTLSASKLDKSCGDTQHMQLLQLLFV